MNYSMKDSNRIYEVTPGFNGKHHPLLNDPVHSQTLQSRLVDPLNILGKFEHSEC